ncbi:MAG: transglycosylase SLT domain-containing protein [Gallionella sp.]
MRFILCFLLLIAPPAMARPAATSPPQNGEIFVGSRLPGDSDFLAAHDAFLAGDKVKLDRYAQRLKNSPLEVYASYYQLSLALDNIDQHPVPTALESAVKRFLSRPEDTPVIDQLRGEWLKVLGKRQQWDEFHAEYPHLRDQDTELACYALQSRRRNQESEALRRARQLWFTGKQQPDSCGTLFDAALAAGIISKQDVSRRLRLALEGNNVSFAIQLSALLDDQYAGLPGMLRSAAADPVRYLNKLPPVGNHPGRNHPSSGKPAAQARTSAPGPAPIADIKPPASSVASVSSVASASPVDVAARADAKAAAQAAGKFDWGNLWSWVGLDKAGNPPPTAGSTPSSASPVSDCDASCPDVYDDDTVPPMGWDPRLASRGQRVAALFALDRLAKQSPDLAAAHWAKIAGYFPSPEQQYCYGRLAYQAARNLDGRALQWYRDASGTPLNEQQSAWRVRAALRARDWPEVLASINAMNAQQQHESAWLYWKARALEALGNIADARAIFAPLSAEYSFYGQLAGDELSGTAVLSQAMPAYKPDSQAIAAVSAMPGVQRTLTLYRIGMRTEALDEWRWLVGNLNDRQLLTAAEIARRNRMYDRAIGAAEKTVSEHDFSMRYLAPYRTDLQVHLREQGLDEAWVYGLMRQESRFATSAKSETGAAGLMQIMPATARWVAKKLGLRSYHKTLIHQLDTNLRIGTYYMKTVLSQSQNNPVLASAAYNAGPIRALQWRGDKPLEGAIYAETIPYEETRDYVEKVMSNTVYYANQFGDPPRSLKQLLGTIPGRSSDSPAANDPQSNSDGK